MDDPVKNRPPDGHSVSKQAESSSRNPMRTIPFFSKPLAAGVAAALFLAGSAAGAFAAEVQSDPIHVDDVQVTSQSTNDRGTMPIATRIAFTNEYSAPATHVVFLLEANGSVVDRFDDVGSFAPGVQVRHTFPERQSGGRFSVIVAAASFADGSTWQNQVVAAVPGGPEPINAGTSADSY
jgi:hypothetical protein